MKHTKLTHAKLSQIDPATIIYADFNRFPAFGDAGMASLYIFDVERPTFYLIDAGMDGVNSDGKEYTQLDELIQYLGQLETIKILESAPAGGHGRAFRRPHTTFAVDDDHQALLYTSNGKTYQTTPSKFMFRGAHQAFAKRQISTAEIENYLNQLGDPQPGDSKISASQPSDSKLSPAENDFLRTYLSHLKSIDDEAAPQWIDFSPLDYFNFVEYSKHAAGEKGASLRENLDYDPTIAWFRLQFASNQLGWNKLNSIIAAMIKDQTHNLFDRVSKVIQGDIAKPYSPLAELRPAEVKLSPLENLRLEDLRKERLFDLSEKPQQKSQQTTEQQKAKEQTTAQQRAEQLFELEKLFSHPVLINFTPEERQKIIAAIRAMSDEELENNSPGIGYFLANYIFHQTKWPAEDIANLATYLAAKAPFQHPETEAADEVSWLCDEIICTTSR